MTIKEMADQSGIDYAKIRTIMMKHKYYRPYKYGYQDYDPKKVKDLMMREMQRRIERLRREMDRAIEELDTVIDWKADE